nr:phosphatidate cytidylyltransferase [Rhizobiaceae bacterium]
SGVILAAIALCATLLGGVWFKLLAIAIGALALSEWLAIACGGGDDRMRISAGVALALVAASLLVLSPLTTWWAFVATALVVYVLVLNLGQSFWALGGYVYAGATMLALALLRGNDGAGLATMLYLFAVVWATDIAAYFTGRRFGGPKLWPRVSPGKTWSGAVGGVVGAVTGGLVVAGLAGATNLGLAAVLALLLSIVAQFGDLGESAIKRRFGVKDSGNTIPGHGGVLDRIDGLAAASVALFAIGAMIQGVAAPAHLLF